MGNSNIQNSVGSYENSVGNNNQVSNANNVLPPGGMSYSISDSVESQQQSQQQSQLLHQQGQNILVSPIRESRQNSHLNNQQGTHHGLQQVHNGQQLPPSYSQQQQMIQQQQMQQMPVIINTLPHRERTPLGVSQATQGTQGQLTSAGLMEHNSVGGGGQQHMLPPGYIYASRMQHNGTPTGMSSNSSVGNIGGLLNSGGGGSQNVTINSASSAGVVPIPIATNINSGSGAHLRRNPLSGGDNGGFWIDSGPVVANMRSFPSSTSMASSSGNVEGSPQEHHQQRNDSNDALIAIEKWSEFQRVISTSQNELQTFMITHLGKYQQQTARTNYLEKRVLELLLQNEEYARQQQNLLTELDRAQQIIQILEQQQQHNIQKQQQPQPQMMMQQGGGMTAYLTPQGVVQWSNNPGPPQPSQQGLNQDNGVAIDNSWNANYQPGGGIQQGIRDPIPEHQTTQEQKQDLSHLAEALTAEAAMATPIKLANASPPPPPPSTPNQATSTKTATTTMTTVQQQQAQRKQQFQQQALRQQQQAQAKAQGQPQGQGQPMQQQLKGQGQQQGQGQPMQQQPKGQGQPVQQGQQQGQGQPMQQQQPKGQGQPVQQVQQQGQGQPMQQQQPKGQGQPVQQGQQQGQQKLSQTPQQSLQQVQQAQMQVQQQAQGRGAVRPPTPPDDLGGSVPISHFTSQQGGSIEGTVSNIEINNSGVRKQPQQGGGSEITSPVLRVSSENEAYLC